MNARTLGLVVLIPTILALTACGIDRRQDRRDDRRDDRQSQTTSPTSQAPQGSAPSLPQTGRLESAPQRA